MRKIKVPLIGTFNLSVSGFLAALILLLAASPFIVCLDTGDLIESLLVTIMLASGALAAGHNHKVSMVGILMAVIPISCKWLHYYHPDPIFAQIYLSGGILFLLFIIAQFLLYIIRAPAVNREVLCAAIAVYLMLGLLWSFGYTLVSINIPEAFAFNAGPPESHHMSGVNSLYFSFITLCTVGYGDITPVADIARMMSAAEAMTGTLFMAILISRLVSLYSGSTASRN